ncbi:hypothetical protein Ctob_014918, partial [Chrysochromulina tobinii]
MNIAVGEEEFTITVPDGVYGGDAIDVDLPVQEAPPEEGVVPTTVTIIIPDGCYPGDEFTVEFDGRSFNIGVPDGCEPGMELQVEVPAEEPPPEDTRPRRPKARRPEELVGRRVKLVGLVAKGVLNGRKGTVNSYNAQRERLLMTIDGMADVPVAVKWENVEELPEDDEAPVDDEPPEAPPAGVHYVGDRVLVERSNGSTSLGTVVEYDEALETYVIDIGNGILKYGVEESYLTPYETTSEWAGPSKKNKLGFWEGYFIGRKVRLPHLGGGNDDKNGTIRGYNETTGLYIVEMESGVMRKSVLPSQIRVLYQLVPNVTLPAPPVSFYRYMFARFDATGMTFWTFTLLAGPIMAEPEGGLLEQFAALLRQSSRGRKVLENREAYDAWLVYGNKGVEEANEHQRLKSSIAVIQHHVGLKQSTLHAVDERIGQIESAIKSREASAEAKERAQREAAFAAAAERAAAERAAEAELVAQREAAVVERAAIERAAKAELVDKIAGERAARRAVAQQCADERLAAERVAAEQRLADERETVEKAAAGRERTSSSDVADGVLQSVAQRVAAAREAARAEGEVAARRLAVQEEAEAKAEAEKAEAEKAAAEKAAAEKAATEKAAAENEVTDDAASDKAA